MSDDFGSLFEAICTRDLSIAKPAVTLAVSIRDKEFIDNGYTDIYYDYDDLVEDFNNIFDENVC
jgi:hypothetical protein